MTKLFKRIWGIAGLLLWAGQVCAAPDEKVCSSLSNYFVNQKVSSLSNPARELTPAEFALIDQTSSNLLQVKEYAEGIDVVDADNDGQEDVFVWSIQGSGRFLYAELYKRTSSELSDVERLVLSASMELGVLESPRFVRFEEVNYLVFSVDGSSEGLQITQISQTSVGKYELRTVCGMHTSLQAKTSCRHSACKELERTIEDYALNGAFVSVQRPDKYYSPAGLRAYFPYDAWKDVDFDNTGNITSIWRIGGDNTDFQYAYGRLLGLGQEAPYIDPKLRTHDDAQSVGRVLPGQQHNRLRRALAQQSQVLSLQLAKPVSLPNDGAFLLFTANNGRTYWGWELGEQPLGDEIHILYTNVKKSDYIGAVGIQRTLAMVPCTTNCVRPITP